MTTRTALHLAAASLLACAMMGCAAPDATDEDLTEETEAEGEAATSEDAISSSYPVCSHTIQLRSGYVWLRSGPGTNYAPVGERANKIYDGDLVYVLTGKVKNKFLKVGYGAGGGWVAAKYVSRNCF